MQYVTDTTYPTCSPATADDVARFRWPGSWVVAWVVFEQHPLWCAALFCRPERRQGEPRAGAMPDCRMRGAVCRRFAAFARPFAASWTGGFGQRGPGEAR